jgi:hypothetical protein
MTEKEWLAFFFAVQEIERSKSVSRGKAQSMLRQACASGEVQSQKQPYIIVHHQMELQGPPEQIEPSEWRNREIDFMTDEHGCEYTVDVDEADFRYWLGQQKAKLGKQPTKRIKIKAFLAEKFHNQPVPDDYVRKDLLNELRGCGDPLFKQLDDATLNTAIVEHNSELT